MPEAQSVRQDIEQRNREFCAAFNRGDAAGVASVYVEDAQVLPPGGAKVSGRQATQQFWQGAMGMGVREVELNTEHAEAVGDLAYEIGSASLKIQAQGGSPTTDTVKYLVVWKRQSGGPWQIAADIWNSNTTG